MTSNSGDKIIKKQVDTMQVSFDKEAAWLRLQDRMESRDERRRPMWMGWAAAAVLVLATVVWYSRSERKQVVVKENKTGNMPIAVQQEPQRVAQENKNEELAPKVSNPVTITKKQPKAVQQYTVTPIVEYQPVPAIEIPIVVRETAIEPEVPVASTMPKRNLKRVHINDVVDEDRTARQMTNKRIDERYAAGRKYGLIRPATEREDADEDIYSLLGKHKTEVN